MGGLSEPWGELGSSWDVRVRVLSPHCIVLSLLCGTFFFAVFPASVSKLVRGSTATGEVVTRASGEIASSKALISLVSVLLGGNLVVLEVDIASGVASIDG